MLNLKGYFSIFSHVLLQEATEAINKSISLWLPQLKEISEDRISGEDFDSIEVIFSFFLFFVYIFHFYYY